MDLSISNGTETKSNLSKDQIIEQLGDPYVQSLFKFDKDKSGGKTIVYYCSGNLTVDCQCFYKYTFSTKTKHWNQHDDSIKKHNDKCNIPMVKKLLFQQSSDLRNDTNSAGNLNLSDVIIEQTGLISEKKRLAFHKFCITASGIFYDDLPFQNPNDEQRRKFITETEDVVFHQPISDSDMAVHTYQRTKLLCKARQTVAKLIKHIQLQNPHHIHTVLSILSSDYHTNAQGLHMDYDTESSWKNLDKSLHPFSVMIPISDSFSMMIVHSSNKAVNQIVVHPGYFLLFRGNVKHGGGRHEGDTTNYRMHIYFFTDMTHSPNGNIYRNYL